MPCFRDFLVTAAVISFASSVPTDDDCQRAFKEFVLRYDKTYDSVDQRAKAAVAFCHSLAYVEAENAKQNKFTLVINELADLVPENFGARLGLGVPPTRSMGAQLLGTDRYSGAPLPESIDWVARGAVTMPKNQGQCGACWSFATTGALEGAWYIASGKLVSLSEQQLVDCSKNGGNDGCNGGLMTTAFHYLSSKAVCAEANYSYTADAGKCLETTCTVGIPPGQVSGFREVPSGDEKALMEAVSKQPIAVGIEADQSPFTLYSHGILKAQCGSHLNHGVLLVGYGTENGTDYWKVKNSWGPQWGEDGYIRLERGMSEDGECGINTLASYPVVADSVTESPFLV